MDFSSLIKTLKQRLGIADLEQDSDGRVQFTVDGKLSIDVEPGPDGKGLVLVGRLGTVPAGSRERVFQRMLELNLLERGASGSFLALDVTYDGMVLCRRFDEIADYTAFEHALELFINQCEGVQLSLTQGAAPAAQAPEAWEGFALRA
jgi:hypothetical protein